VRLGHERGISKYPGPESPTNEQISQFGFHGRMNLSSTSLGSAQRTSKLLGRKPKAESIFEDTKRALDDEAKLIGLQEKQVSFSFGLKSFLGWVELVEIVGFFYTGYVLAPNVDIRILGVFFPTGSSGHGQLYPPDGISFRN